MDRPTHRSVHKAPQPPATNLTPAPVAPPAATTTHSRTADHTTNACFDAPQKPSDRVRTSPTTKPPQLRPLLNSPG